MIQIFIRVLDGKTITLDVTPYDLVQFVKQKIQNKTGVPVDHQCLFFIGRPLFEGSDGNNSLADYGIEQESTLHLLLRCKGGAVSNTASDYQAFIRTLMNQYQQMKHARVDSTIDFHDFMLCNWHQIRKNRHFGADTIVLVWRDAFPDLEVIEDNGFWSLLFEDYINYHTFPQVPPTRPPSPSDLWGRYFIIQLDHERRHRDAATLANYIIEAVGQAKNDIPSPTLFAIPTRGRSSSDRSLNL